MTNTPVQRVLFEGKQAVGVQASGEKCQLIMTMLQESISLF